MNPLLIKPVLMLLLHGVQTQTGLPDKYSIVQTKLVSLAFLFRDMGVGVHYLGTYKAIIIKQVSNISGNPARYAAAAASPVSQESFRNRNCSS
jgi:hypothetical protein